MKEETQAPDPLSSVLSHCGELLKEAAGDGQTVVIVVGDAFRLRVYNSAGGDHAPAVELLRRAGIAMGGRR